MDPVDALERLGGVATARDLLRLTTRRPLRTALDAGRIRRLATGRYALPTAAASLTLAGAHGAYVSHLCAAAHHGWEIAHQPALPQLAVPRHRSTPGDLLAEVTRLPSGTRDFSGPATGPVLTVMLCARDLPFGEALAVADSCLRHGAATHDQLVAAAAGWPPGVRRVAGYADARAANPFESVLRALAIEAGLDVIPQYEVRAGGLVLHPDLVDPLRGIVLEADSWGFHASRYEHDRDCVRYNALVATDWRVLRFTHDHVLTSGSYVVSTIRRVARAAAA